MVPRARDLVGFADLAEALERLAASEAAGGTSIRATVLSHPVWPDLELSASMTLVVLPLPALDNTLEPTWYELVENLVTYIRVPVLVLPQASPAAPHEPRPRVLAALQGSPASAKVLEATAALAQATSARVHVLQVGTDAPRHLANERAHAPGGARAWADRASHSLRNVGLDAVGRAVLGHAAAPIPAVAEEIGADVIVLGTPAQAGKNDWLGSTTSAALRHMQRPILLIHADAVMPSCAPTASSVEKVDGEPLPSSETAHSCDVHTPSSANTDRLDTVS